MSMVSRRTGETDRLLRWFEQLNGVAIRIFELDLSAARADFHLIAKTQFRLPQPFDATGEIRDTKNDAVPSARLLTLAVRHRTRTRRPGAAEQEPQLS